MRFIFLLIVFAIAFSSSEKKFVFGYDLVKSFFLPNGPRLTRVRHIDEQSRAVGDDTVVLDTVSYRFPESNYSNYSTRLESMQMLLVLRGQATLEQDQNSKVLH